jgi:hypothetical protein
MQKIEIPLSKTKILLGIGGSVLLVVAGVFLFTTIANDYIGAKSMVVKAIGVIGVLFFSSTGIYGVKKLFDNKIGLTIDEAGITDHSTATSIGFIPWTDITEIRTEQVMSTKFLLIFTRDPIPFLEKVTGIRRKLLEANLKMYGTPFSITSNTLQYDFNSLEKLLRERLNNR